MAFKAKLHRTYISDVERGKKNISLENIGRLAWALKIHLHELMNF
ncbi:MAG: helix-turn-helix transcriptional regulator [bacterium]